MARAFKYLLPLIFIICYNLNNYGQEIDTFKESKQNFSWDKFYCGMEMGIGWLELAPYHIKGNKETSFSMAFFGGYTPVKWLQLGVSLNGYLIESYDSYRPKDPNKGAGISNAFIQSRITPFEKGNLLINLEGGLTNYWSFSTDGYQSNGIGYKIGVGYKLNMLWDNIISINLNYGSGKFNKGVFDQISNRHIDNSSYKVLNLALNGTYKF